MMYQKTFATPKSYKSYEFDSLDGRQEVFAPTFSMTGEELYVSEKIAAGVKMNAAKDAWKKLSMREKNAFRERARKERREDRRDAREEKKDLRDAFEKRAKDLGVKGYKAKKAAFAPSRGAFLGLIVLNFRGLATRLQAFRNTPGEIEIERTWYKLGGRYDMLLEAVAKGRDKRPLLCGAKCKAKLPANFMDFLPFDGLYNYPTGVEETAAAAATAAPVTTQIVSVLGTLATVGTAVSGVTKEAAKISDDVEKVVTRDEEEDDKDLTPEEKAAAEAAFAEAADAATKAAETAVKTEENKNNSNTILIVAVVAVALLMFTRR